MCQFEAQPASHLHVHDMVWVCLPRQALMKMMVFPLSESVQPRIKINVF